MQKQLQGDRERKRKEQESAEAFQRTKNKCQKNSHVNMKLFFQFPDWLSR